MDQVALDKAYLRSLVVKLSDTLMMLQRANVAYRDSLRFIRSCQSQIVSNLSRQSRRVTLLRIGSAG